MIDAVIDNINSKLSYRLYIYCYR